MKPFGQLGAWTSQNIFQYVVNCFNIPRAPYILGSFASIGSALAWGISVYLDWATIKEQPGWLGFVSWLTWCAAMGARCYYLWTRETSDKITCSSPSMFLPRMIVAVVPLAMVIMLALTSTVSFQWGLLAQCVGTLLLWSSFCFESCHSPDHTDNGVLQGDPMK